MRGITLWTILVLSISSCKNKPSINIIGTWKLDSTIHNNNKKTSAYEALKIQFLENGHFLYDYREGDVMYDYKGKFHLKDSDNFKKLELITDTLNYGAKPFQIQFKYTILGVSKNVLVTSNEEFYSLANDSIVSHKRIDFFKKIE
jgi:hypothetical protein